MPLTPRQAQDRLAYLAKELAHNIRSRADILSSIGMEASEWATVSNDPEFLTLLLDEKRRWLETVNTRTRTRTKTAALLEDLIETICGDVIDGSLPLGPRVQLLKTLAGIGGLETVVGDGPGFVSTGNTFNLMITYANGTEPDIIRLGGKVIEEETPMSADLRGRQEEDEDSYPESNVGEDENDSEP